MSWMERGERGGTLKTARLADGKIDQPRTVVTDSRMFVNWADLPAVTHVADGHFLAHWLRYSADKTYSYDVVVSQTFDDGESWSTPIVIHDDGTPTEHGFVSMYRDVSGVGLIWLDGRNTPDGPMTLRSAVIDVNGTVRKEQQLDADVCDCCQTDVAMTSNGPLAVYRDRTRDEIRDIHVARHDGRRWLPGRRLYADNWHIPGCPVNGPSIVAGGDVVAIAWFSAADDRPIVRVVVSTDAGESFDPPVEIASGSVAGYVGIDVLDARHVVVSWVAKTGSGENAVMVRAVEIDGTTGPPVHVGFTNQLRVFPQVTVSGEQIVVIWTDDTDGQRQLRTAVAPWNSS